MTQKVTMTGSSSLRLLDWRTSLWLSRRTFSTSSSVLISPMQSVAAKSSLNAFGSHDKATRHAIDKRYLLSPLLFKSLEHACCMSNNREPPDITGEHPSPDHDKETKHTGKRLNNGGLENMLRLVKEKSSGMQAFGKQLSERSSSVITRITPEINLASTLDASVKEGKKPDDWNDILNRWYMKYQDFIGITDLKRAQDKVTELSEGLLGTQSRRRNLQAELEDLQEQLTLNHQRITKTELYSEEHYQLFDQARDMNARLKEVRSQFESCERLERDTFTGLSAAIRDCHERERTQAEQSKYWSIIASIVSAALASVITSVNNWVRIREIKDHVSVNNQALLEGYQKMHEDIVGAVNANMANTAASIVEISKTLESGSGNVDSAGTAVATTANITAPISEKSDGALESSSGNVGSVETTVEVATNTTSSPVRLAEEDIMLLSKAFGKMLQEQVSVVLANETKLMQETIKPHLDAIFANLGLILEGNRTLAEEISAEKKGDLNESTVEDVSKMEVISPTLSDDGSEKQEFKSVVVDYSYKHIASAMAVGAGIGTLATSFLLGSFTGGGAAE